MNLGWNYVRVKYLDKEIRPSLNPPTKILISNGK